MGDEEYKDKVMNQKSFAKRLPYESLAYIDDPSTDYFNSLVSGGMSAKKAAKEVRKQTRVENGT